MSQNAQAASTDFTRLSLVDYSVKSQMKPGAPRDCVLLKPVAEALSRAHQAAKLVSSSLKVLECYRPFSSAPKRNLKLRQDLARGSVLEVILADSNGGPIALPRPHDQAIMLSATPYKKSDALKNVEKLNALLKAEGFEPDPKVWWRFTWVKAAQSEIEDFNPDSLPKKLRIQ